MDGSLESVLLPAAGIFLISGTLQGVSGFGLALVAVPVLASFVEPQIAVPVATLAGGAVAALMIARFRQHCDWGRAAWLGVPALCIAPFGVHLLKALTASQLRLGLGVVLIGSALFSFFRKAPAPDAPRTSRLGSVCVGGFSGVLGGALGMTGPLLADYLIKSGIRREEFSITLNLIFVASAAWRTGLYFAQGLMTGPALQVACLAVPVALTGAAIGILISRRIKNEAFVRFVNVLLVAIGIWMIVEGARKP